MKIKGFKHVIIHWQNAFHRSIFPICNTYFYLLCNKELLQQTKDIKICTCLFLKSAIQHFKLKILLFCFICNNRLFYFTTRMMFLTKSVFFESSTSLKTIFNFLVRFSMILLSDQGASSKLREI